MVAVLLVWLAGPTTLPAFAKRIPWRHGRAESLMTHFWIRHATLLCASLLLLSVFATPAMARPRAERHYCESRNGVTIVKKGRTKCVIDGTSYAKAEGKKSIAIAFDYGVATASGEGSHAQAGGTGSPGSRAKASGYDSYAIADTGGEAYASGDGSYASAHVGYATSNGTNSRAVAVDPGSFAKANGTDSKRWRSGSQWRVQSCSVCRGRWPSLG